MKIYNTFSEIKEELSLRGQIGIYVCGITPDGPTHLGHAFLFVTYDTLIRYLKFLERDVIYVQNVTDVDDDILIRSKAAGLTWKEMGDRQTKAHLKDMDKLNVIRPDFYPKATENIKQMIAIIKKLLSKNMAYIKNGSVYFSVSADKNFGKLSKFGYRAMLEIANDRGNFPLDPNKVDPLDFVLWQAKKAGEPSWSSPWGEGRPGWHIECSAMSMRFLGPTLTIHGGGSDLIFPHHEAEIAQSENSTGQKFVKIWMHAAMVFCDGKKMSKSLGNMIFVSDLIKKYSSNTIRILLLSHNYQTPWNYYEGELKEAQNKAEIIEKSALQTKLTNSQVKKIIPNFFKALDDNLNTPLAIESLIKLTKSNDVKAKQAVFACAQILGFKF